MLTEQMVSRPAAGPLVRLDERQRQVVEHDGGPLLVLGGPGTGKSTVLAERWVHLAAEVTEPHRVLLLVGSRARAAALRDELPWRLPRGAIIEVPVHTWHALSYHLATRYHRALGWPAPPVLLTSAEQWAVVRDLLSAEDPSAWGPYGQSLTSRAFVDEVADFCLRAGHRLTSDAALRDLARGGESAQAARFCLRYREHLHATVRLDAPGLVAAAARLVSERDDVREAIARRFPHVLVDDAHELTTAQLALLEHLALDGLVCAADADSCVEAFGGADPAWLARFASGDWAVPQPHVVTLDTCHRSGSAIGRAAGRLIAHDPYDGHHRPAAFDGPADATAEVRVHATLAGEVDAAAREIKAAHLDGVEYERMAVLLAQPGSYAAPVRRALEGLGVPSRVVGADRPLAAEAAVRHVLDLCRAVLEPEGPDDVLRGVLASPVVGCQPHVVRDLARDAFKHRVRLADVVAESEVCAEYRRLAGVVAADPGEPADATFERVFAESRWAQDLVGRRRADPQAAGDVAALAALARALGRFVERRSDGTMRDYLQTSARSEYWTDPWEPPGPPGGVQILSLHAARGGEWDVVCVLGLGEGQVPKSRRAQGLFDPWTARESAVERAREAVAEQRRSLYVALTRARRRLVASCSPGPSGRVTPSRFLEEAFGVLPEPAGETEPASPLTLAEAEWTLRRVLADPDAGDARKAAAACALAQLPGSDPSAWWWRFDWTTHPEPLAPTGKLVTSYSRIGRYENCPLQYVLQSVLGLDPQTSYQMKFGSLVHRVIELVERGEITGWEHALRTYKAGFDPSDYPNMVFARTYYRSGVRMLKLWWRSERTLGETIDVEYSFNDLDLDGHTIRGRIDRVAKTDKGLRLVDYKTSRTLLQWDKARTSLQLAIYYLAAKTYDDLRQHGDPYRMLLVYPAYEDFDEPGTPAKRYQRPDDAEETIESLKGYLADAAQERFAPSPEADCQWCRMRPLCPRWPEGREVTP